MDKYVRIASFLRSQLELGEYHVPNYSIPELCVVGMQSAGKSSVLESIVGKEFLPRGTGTVTRAPIRLTVQPLPEKSSEEYAEFETVADGHRDKTKMALARVPEEITRRTEEILKAEPPPQQGTLERHVTETEIALTIHTGAVDTPLVLVDLPGLVLHPVGKQPPDVVQRVFRITEQRIRKMDTVVMCVVRADDERNARPALALITGKEVLGKRLEPVEGHRLIVVATNADKCTTADKRDPLLKLLGGDDLQLPSGTRTCAVVCRDTAAAADVSIGDALKKESTFLAQMFPELMGRCGTKQLVKILGETLFAMYKDAIPALTSQIKTDLRELQHQYQRIQQPEPAVLANLFDKYKFHFEQFVLEGAVKYVSDDIEDGGSLFRGNFVSFSRELSKMDPFRELNKDKRSRILKAAMGPGLSLGTYDRAFREIMPNQILRMQSPALQVIETCTATVMTLLERFTKRFLEVEGFEGLVPVVTKQFKRAFNEIVEDRSRHCTEMVQAFVEAQAEFINLDHPEIRLVRDHQGNPSKLNGVVPAIGNLLSFSDWPLTVLDPATKTFIDAGGAVLKTATTMALGGSFGAAAVGSAAAAIGKAAASSAIASPSQSREQSTDDTKQSSDNKHLSDLEALDNYIRVYFGISILDFQLSLGKESNSLSWLDDTSVAETREYLSKRIEWCKGCLSYINLQLEEDSAAPSAEFMR